MQHAGGGGSLGQQINEIFIGEKEHGVIRSSTQGHGGLYKLYAAFKTPLQKSKNMGLILGFN